MVLERLPDETGSIQNTPLTQLVDCFGGVRCILADNGLSLVAHKVSSFGSPAQHCHS